MKPSGNNSTSLRAPANFGVLIRRRRKALGLTQASLAEQANVGRRFLIELEDGKPTVQLGKVLRILSMLGVSLMASEA